MRNALFISILLVLGCVATPAQTSEMTYQGNLTDGSTDASGTYQMRFSLYDAASGGAQIGQTLEYGAVEVAGGIFSVSLDFGASSFDGSERYLQIEVRRNSGEAYVALAPRQRIKSVPYAIKSMTSMTATTADTATNALNLGGTDASQFVVTTDERLSDERTPTAGSPDYIQNTTTEQPSSNFNISGTGEAGVFDAATQFNLNGARILSAPNTNNLFVGLNAGTSNTLGNQNTFIGTGAGASNSAGLSNTFVGWSTGGFNTTGANNSFFGRRAGYGNTNGSRNSYFGKDAGEVNSEGNDNSFFGWRAGVTNSASQNSFFGSGAGAANTTASRNSFFGFNAGAANRASERNSFFGAYSGASNTAGAANSFFGDGAGELNTVGSNNSFFGTDSGQSNTTGQSNSFFGRSAGEKTTIGENNSFFGESAGRENIEGTGNSFYGYRAGMSSLSNYNSFFGFEAGSSNTSGFGNSFFGRQAGLGNTTGGSNSFFGLNAGSVNTEGSSNSFFGREAGRANTTGSFNSFFGYDAGQRNISGQYNTFIGRLSGQINETGSYNTALGYRANLGFTDLSYATAIGAEAVVNASNTIVLGRPVDRTIVSGELTVLAGEVTAVDRADVNFIKAGGNFNLYLQGGNGTKGINFGVDSGATNAKLFISQFDGTTYLDRIVVNQTGAVEIRQLGSGGSTDVCRNSNNELATCSSSIRYKTGVTDFTPGLDVVRKLRPVFYKWKDGGMPDVGLVAEEVAEVEPLLTTQNERGEVEGVKYDRVGVVLVNAVQEQQAQIDIQQKEIADQRKELAKQQRTIEEQRMRIDRLERLVCSLAGDPEFCQEEKQ